MEAGLVSLLTNEASISAVVGTAVYVGNIPQRGTYPCILITQMGSDEYNSLDATGNLRRVTFDIDCKADTSLAASALADIVREFIKDYTGVAGSQTIDAVHLNGETATVESMTDGSDVHRYVKTLDVDIHYTPA